MADISIKWGKRVNIANMFPTIGSLEEMYRSMVIRGKLVENVSAQDMATHGITQNPLGKWETAKPDRDSTISMSDEEILLFDSFIQDLSKKKQVPLIFADVFSAIDNLAKEIEAAKEKESEEEQEEEGGE